MEKHKKLEQRLKQEFPSHDIRVMRLTMGPRICLWAGLEGSENWLEVGLSVPDENGWLAAEEHAKQLIRLHVK